MEVTRKTRETRIRVRVRKGAGRTRVQVPDVFYGHMLEAFATWGDFDLEVEATGDMPHHWMEDVAITLGRALRDEIDVTRIRRVGLAYVPMDDALVRVAVDVGDRPFFVGELPDKMYAHVLRSIAFEARLTLHVDVVRGHDEHHIVEAAFKGLGLALSDALQPRGSIRSTKGAVKLRKRGKR